LTREHERRLVAHSGSKRNAGVLNSKEVANQERFPELGLYGKARKAISKVGKLLKRGQMDVRGVGEGRRIREKRMISRETLKSSSASIIIHEEKECIASLPRMSPNPWHRLKLEAQQRSELTLDEGDQ